MVNKNNGNTVLIMFKKKKMDTFLSELWLKHVRLHYVELFFLNDIHFSVASVLEILVTISK